MVKAEALPANRLIQGEDGQTKPKVQLANLTADIARSVWLFNHTELTDRHAREANAEEARELSLFTACQGS